MCYCISCSHFRPQALLHIRPYMTNFDFLKYFQGRDFSFFSEKLSAPFAKCSVISSALYLLASSGYICSLASGSKAVAKREWMARRLNPVEVLELRRGNKECCKRNWLGWWKAVALWWWERNNFRKPWPKRNNSFCSPVALYQLCFMWFLRCFLFGAVTSGVGW